MQNVSPMDNPAKELDEIEQKVTGRTNESKEILFGCICSYSVCVFFLYSWMK